MNQQNLQDAYAEYDRQVRIANSKLGSILAIILMPLGCVLDYFVYPDHLWEFLKVRFMSAAMGTVVLGLFYTSFGLRHYRILGMAWYMIPAFCIAWMIYAAGDAFSPYYAGLNIVLLGMGLILPSTWMENLISWAMVMAMYLAASFFQPEVLSPGVLFNNIYFLALTGVIVIAGGYSSSRLRFREFALRFELDKNRQMLEQSNRQLVEMAEVKSRFFANISHELRTPLTLLLAPLETLRRRYSHAWDEKARVLLSTMDANGMRLLKLINDLLDLVRLESGKIEVKRDSISIPEFILGMASAVRQVADDKQVRLQTVIGDHLGIVVADRDKLEKIVLNLLFNALKFTSGGGKVSLNAWKKEDRLVIAVQDTGIGIAEKNLPFVFDRFWQADSSSRRRHSGAGLGLALVKELTEVQGGRVSVESREGKGTTFTVEIPCREELKKEAAAPSPKAEGAWEKPTASSEEWLANLYRRAELFPSMTLSPEKPVSEPSCNGQGPVVLVAEDEPDMLRFLKSHLSEQYAVVEASDGEQAVAKARETLPDLILLDMMMPVKDGLQACRELREPGPTVNIPIILLTARADEETKLAALSAGASDFLAKPFSTTELHVRIKNLVDSHHFQKRLAQQNQILETMIEQLKETEIQLVQTEKLASLGRMSAGIIHEINNPLNFAATGLYTLRNQGQFVPPDHQGDFAETLRDVEEGISRVKNIVSDLRTFTHPDAEDLDQVDVTEALVPAVRFLSNEWKDKVEIHRDVSADLTVWANKNRLTQVFVNVLQNSLDAFKNKTFHNGEKPEIRITGRVEPDKIVVTLRDNGEGIQPAHLDKIFDPFFTTKEVGEGMGLGLSICYRIMQRSQGQIRVTSEPGKFCEVVLEFPRELKPQPRPAAVESN